MRVGGLRIYFSPGSYLAHRPHAEAARGSKALRLAPGPGGHCSIYVFHSCQPVVPNRDWTQCQLLNLVDLGTYISKITPSTTDHTVKIRRPSYRYSPFSSSYSHRIHFARSVTRLGHSFHFIPANRCTKSGASAQSTPRLAFHGSLFCALTLHAHADRLLTLLHKGIEGNSLRI